MNKIKLLSKNLKNVELKHIFIVSLFLLTMLTFTSFKFNPLINTKASLNFVSYSGTHFTLNSNPFYVGGTNNHYIAWASHNEIDNVLNDASSLHLNVVRTFVSSVRGSLDTTTKPTIWNWNNNGDPNNLGMEGTYFQYWDTNTNKMAFNDGVDGLAHIDYILSKAQNLNIKILLSFNDSHWYTGGLQQMAEWYGIRSVSGKTDDYHNVYADTRVKQDYKDWISHLLNHVNVFTGVAYKDDPTIFGWDLINEPAADSKTLLQSWITEMSTYVKSIDHNHLLATGNEGYFGQGGDDPVQELAMPNIDFGTMHTYPVYTHLSSQQTSDLIQQHCTIAQNANKPLLLEEFGISYTDSAQASKFKLWLDNLNNNDNCGGFLFWRLVSHEDGITGYPNQNSEGFDIHNDGGSAVTTLSNEAVAIQSKNISFSSSSSSLSSSISSISSSSNSSSTSSNSSSRSNISSVSSVISSSSYVQSSYNANSSSFSSDITSSNLYSSNTLNIDNSSISNIVNPVLSYTKEIPNTDIKSNIIQNLILVGIISGTTISLIVIIILLIRNRRKVS